VFRVLKIVLIVLIINACNANQDLKSNKENAWLIVSIVFLDALNAQVRLFVLNVLMDILSMETSNAILYVLLINISMWLKMLSIA
jgi:hypothetical protein